MGQYTTDRDRSARTACRAPGNGFEAGNYAPRGVERPPARACAVCGASLEARRRQTRYCSPSCRARAFDRRTGRISHATKPDN
jgi:hypothetical protein